MSRCNIELPATLVVDSRCILGEGVLWCDREQVVLWTDIQSSALWQHRPADGATHRWDLPARLGAFALCESGRLLMGMEKGLYIGDLRPAQSDSKLNPVLLIPVSPAEPALRINDGRTDRHGNFVFGTLNEDPRRERIGRFYQYSRRYGLRELDLPGVAIPNSICFDLEGTRMYFCDSTAGRIMTCRYDSQSAEVGTPEVFALVPLPVSADGSVIDRDGHLWNAQWAAGSIVRYSLDGKIERSVALPTSHPSCLTFGGAELDQIFITTARMDLSELRLNGEPHAGGLFRTAAAPAVGLPEAKFDDMTDS